VKTCKHKNRISAPPCRKHIRSYENYRKSSTLSEGPAGRNPNYSAWNSFSKSIFELIPSYRIGINFAPFLITVASGQLSGKRSEEILVDTNVLIRYLALSNVLIRWEAGRIETGR
jgi:hypothetical protein